LLILMETNNMQETESQPKEKVSEWTSEHKPGEINIKIEEIEPDKIMTPDLKGQSEKLEKDTSEEPPDGEKVSETLSHADRKRIGDSSPG
ncbi:MAG: hypothetical protein AAB558_04140, partial [Patescibacteria group bacterium]